MQTQTLNLYHYIQQTVAWEGNVLRLILPTVAPRLCYSTRSQLIISSGCSSFGCLPALSGLTAAFHELIGKAT
jgi:hypothetical protein